MEWIVFAFLALFRLKGYEGSSEITHLRELDGRATNTIFTLNSLFSNRPIRVKAGGHGIGHPLRSWRTLFLSLLPLGHHKGTTRTL